MAEPFVGEVRIFAGRYAPEGWHFCDGSLLSIGNYQVLYAVLGTIYGGDGSSTFALPDLRGRIALSMGQGPGLQNYVAGQKAGAENVALTTANIPAHNHTLNASTAKATANAAGTGVVLAAAVDQSGAATDGRYLPTGLPTTGTPPVLNSKEVANSAEGGQPHNNIMPSFAINYIIALNGIYPQAN